MRTNPPDWRTTGLTAEALGDIHSFRWLDDLATTGGERAIKAARELIGTWIGEHSDWSEVVWSPDVLGTRIAAWLTHARFVSSGDGDPLGPRILDSLARQARHLSRIAGTGADGVARFRALRGLIYGGAAGISSSRKIDKALQLLSRELARQVLADGGHASRSPAEQIEALGLLVDICGMLQIVKREVPADLTSAIGRMAPMARYYRYRDGRLALFNGATEGTNTLIDAVLKNANATGPAPAVAAESGFARITAAQTLVLMDIGAPAPPGMDARAHAGTLSFELSHGRERLIVNCGGFTSADPAWRQAQRATAAHSTLTIDDTNSSEITETGVGPRRAHVTGDRESTDGNVWITAAHDGYHENFSITHQRRLYVSNDGNDVRGEDTLTGGHHGYFATRFHLHPSVRVSLIQNGAGAIMQLPSGVAWRLQVNGGHLDLTESVYAGEASERRRTEQVVVSGRLAGQGAQIKWALKRVAAT
jgi:uncharacterized heparinase superfamily protein